MRKLIVKILLTLLGIYVLICLLIYFNQEKFIFLPTKLEKNYVFQFENEFEEVHLETTDKINLHSLYFKTEKPKGVVYYLHGNSGDLSGWGDVAGVYLGLGYDVFILDYRGFGKSEGKINNEKQFYEDVQLGYDYLKKKFEEDKIVIVGYSIGTGCASYLASKNSPKILILQAPYYNLSEMGKSRMPFVPTFLLKYKFENHKNIQDVKCPVYIFHGDEDKTIFYEDAVKLKKHLKSTDEYITLKGQGHNGVNENLEFRNKIRDILDISESEKIILNEVKINFKDYKVEIYQGKLANPKFSENLFSKDDEYLNFISEGCKKSGINFAGKYTILTKSCGLDCEHLFIIDRISGKVINNISIKDEKCGFLYRADSKLIIANSNVFVDESLNYYFERWCKPIYFEWNNHDFVEIK